MQQDMQPACDFSKESAVEVGSPFPGPTVKPVVKKAAKKAAQPEEQPTAQQRKETPPPKRPQQFSHFHIVESVETSVEAQKLSEAIGSGKFKGVVDVREALERAKPSKKIDSRESQAGLRSNLPPTSSSLKILQKNVKHSSTFSEKSASTKE